MHWSDYRAKAIAVLEMVLLGWLMLLPPPARAQTGGVPADCNTNGIDDELDIAAGTSADCNFTALPDECEIAAGTAQDCNVNAIPDECDLTSGTSQDCNFTALPDECEIAAGIAGDCNTNAIPDECDFTAGTSEDCNGNAHPDECDLALVPSGVPTQQAKLTAQDGAVGDNFGVSVALSGDTAVVGARYDDDGGWASGSAYVFVRSGGVWAQQTKLTAADAAAEDWFGYSVALSGDTAVVGAYQDDDAGFNSGSAYVFVRSGGIWTQQVKLRAADAAESDRFGYTVALNGDTAIVAATGDDDGGSSSGSAYVFVRSGGVWRRGAKFTASDAAAGDNFGSSVAFSGDTAVVGAYLDNDGGTDSGSAYVFVGSGGVWTQQAKLTAADAAAADLFGYSVALSGDTAVVGALYDDDGGTDSGSAYVFVRSGGVWTQQAKLTAADAAAGDWFGYSVALSGDTAVVGAHQDDDGGTTSGSAYVFVRSGGVWTQQAKLTAADAAAGDLFGYSVALSGDTAVVGAVSDDGVVTYSGSAYVFELGLIPDSLDLNSNGIPDECEEDCNLNGVPDDLDIAAGTSEDCNYTALPDECEIAAGIAEDCNANAVPDECDVDTDEDGLPDGCDPCAGGAMSGDADGDGDVDGSDLADLASCLSGPVGGLGAGCECFDFDADGDMDLIDFAILQFVFTGPGG